MKDGFPLLTTKKMGYKTILRELLWFIQGSTSNQKLQEKNVHIWDLNSTKEFLESRGLDYQEGDLGPVYGFQWRHSGAEYKDSSTDYSGKGIDQLKNVIDLIQNDPHSRRIIMNSWNPSDLDKMALPPCHMFCQFYVKNPNVEDPSPPGRQGALAVFQPGWTNHGGLERSYSGRNVHRG
jgi:thymidylate synthase